MVLKEKRQEVMGLISLFDMKGTEKKILLTPYRRRTYDYLKFIRCETGEINTCRYVLSAFSSCFLLLRMRVNHA